MSYKLIVVCLIFAICCWGCDSVDNKVESTKKEIKQEESETIMTDMDFIELFFDISETEYTIVKVENTLRKDEYNGHYKAIVKVKNEDMPAFIEELDKELNIIENPDESERVFAKNIKGKDLEENDVMFWRTSGLLRKIEGIDANIRGVYRCAIYSDEDAEVYEITLYYGE